MAKTISEEELQLKKRARRRLIGAIALVVVVVVFLPMVLDHEPKQARQDISIQIPEPGGTGAFSSKIIPLAPSPVAESKSPARVAESAAVPPAPVAGETPPPDTEAAPAMKGSTEPPAAPMVPKKVPADTAQSSMEKTKPAAKALPPAKSAAVPKPAVKPQDEKKSSAFVVQIAALSDAEKAKEMQQKITAAGVKAYVEVVPTTKGNVTRVRAGPFPTRDEAEKMRDKLKGLGLAGNIVPK